MPDLSERDAADLAVIFGSGECDHDYRDWGPAGYRCELCGHVIA